MANLDGITESLRDTKLTAGGVSFQGKSLKLDTAEDARVVVDAIADCVDLEVLNLEGNTLGVAAAEAIAAALGAKPQLKRALWKDMFTGRMKTEIPKALEFLGAGLVKANARLIELDLSDNAFGPTGVRGLASLLRSSSCYALEELRLNNNGLGIMGGKLLAESLLDCYESSKKAGKALALKVFIAGRNRLENEGAKALAQVFKTLGTLEELSMPQNGIYHMGVAALSDALATNTRLQILNLNDNTIGPKGATSIAKVLPLLTKLKTINFGDCLLKTKGANLLADGLKSLSELEELALDANEIRVEGALAIVEALEGKRQLRSLTLDGNQFGEDVKTVIETSVKRIGKFHALGSLDECESEDEEESDDDDEEEEEEEEEEHDEGSESESKEVTNLSLLECSYEDFVQCPSADTFLGLGEDREAVLLEQIKKTSESTYLDLIVPTIMKTSALTTHPRIDVSQLALKCTESLYLQLFTWTQTNDATSSTNNALLVHLGLIKSEDKRFKPTWDVKSCLVALESVIGRNFFPDSTKDVLRAFMGKDIEKSAELVEVKRRLIQLLGY